MRAGATQRPPTRFTGLAMIVITMAVLATYLVQAVHTTRRLSSSTVATQYGRNLAQYSCLVAQLHREVPKGGSVYVGGGYDGQVLSELAVGWATLVPAGRARSHLSLETHGSCNQEQVVASP